MASELCPNCGAEVPARAKACPECGADERTGWSEKARYDELGVPDDSFDYDDFIKREFEREKPKRKLQSLWMIVAILVLLAFILAWVF